MRRETSNKGLPDQEARYTLLRQLPSSRPHGQLQPNTSYAQATQQTFNSKTTQQMAPPDTTTIENQTVKEIPTSLPLPTQISSNHSASTRATELYREPHLRRQEHPSTGLIASSTPVMTTPPSHVPHVR
ncbi:hypothetical protein TNCV_3981251 [Trichonephila clavipes]|nr:hypothetical protein TNCV_3981251 [Trichonephila clavipes]